MSVAYAETPADDANPVRSRVVVNWRKGRIVEIRYTPFAQARYSFQTLYGPEPDEAARKILDTIAAHPRQCRVRGYETGVTALIRHMPQDAAPALQPGTPQVVAYVMGLTADEFALGLAVVAGQTAPLQ